MTVGSTVAVYVLAGVILFVGIYLGIVLRDEFYALRARVVDLSDSICSDLSFFGRRSAAALEMIERRLKEMNVTFAERVKAIREAHEKEESDEKAQLDADKAELEKRAARITELEAQVAQNTITPEGEAELKKLEDELGLGTPGAAAPPA